MIATTITNFFQNIDGLTLVATIVIAIIGWIIALFLQRWNIKQEHRVNVRYDIYKQLVVLHKNIQDVVNKLSSGANPPLILMRSSMIPFDLKLKKEIQETWVTYSESECVFEGEKTWTKFIRTLLNDYFDYTNRYSSFSSVLEDWSAAIEPLLPIKKVLNEEINKINKEFIEDLKVLQVYSSSHGHDWRKWKEEEITEVTDRMRNNSLTISFYLVDFMTLLHNQLLSTYFGYRKPIRKTLDPDLKVLTEEGFLVRVEENYEEKLKELMPKD